MQLFDAFVASIINYACPIWGFTKSKDLERIHLKYSKMILGVRQNSCNDAVYGELGRYPLYIIRYVQIIKYWLKLINTDNIILKHVYEHAYEGCEHGDRNWVSNVKALLDDYGFSYIWRNPKNVHIKSFIISFKTRIIDCFCQKWYTDVQSNNVLNTIYVNIKDSFGEEKYLDIVMCKRLRKCITTIRISSHNLRIQTGRFGRERIERNERFCQMCESREVEDEFHFIIKCNTFDALRRKYIRRYYRERPSMFKFIELLKSRNKVILVNLAKFISEANAERNILLLTIPRNQPNDNANTMVL